MAKLFDKEHKVYRRDVAGKDGSNYIFYSIALKDQVKGEWITYWMPINLGKGVELNNKSVIKFKPEDVSYKVSKGYENGQTVIKLGICVYKYELIEDGEKFQPADDFMQIPDGFDADTLPFS